MMKKSEKINKTQETQIFAIYYLSDSGLDNSNIAKKIGVSVKEVNNILSERETKKTSAIKTTSSKVNSKNLMITETAGKRTKNVSIMTKAASEINDSYKQSMPRDTLSRTTKNAIYRPNQNKK